MHNTQKLHTKYLIFHSNNIYRKVTGQLCATDMRDAYKNKERRSKKKHQCKENTNIKKL